MTSPELDAPDNLQEPVQQKLPLAFLHGKAVVDKPEDLYIPPDALEIILETFEGPLDLLLFFIQRDKLDIYDIPISKITNDFLKYISYLNKMNIDIGADFIYMASLLMNIKSKMLLPTTISDEDEEIDPREDLVLKLIEYKKYKDISDELSKVMNDYNLTHKTTIKDEYEIFDHHKELINQKLDLYDIIRTYADLINNIENVTNYELDFEEISVSDQINFVRDILKNKKEITFSNLIKKFNNKIFLIYTFIAILEMIKSREIKIKQKKMFSDIYITNI